MWSATILSYYLTTDPTNYNIERHWWSCLCCSPGYYYYYIAIFLLHTWFLVRVHTIHHIMVTSVVIYSVGLLRSFSTVMSCSILNATQHNTLQYNYNTYTTQCTTTCLGTYRYRFCCSLFSTATFGIFLHSLVEACCFLVIDLHAAVYYVYIMALRFYWYKFF